MKYNKKIIFMMVGLVLVLITAVTTVFAAPDNNKEAVPMSDEVFSCNPTSDTHLALEEFQTAFGVEIVDRNKEINISVDSSKLDGVEFGVYLTYSGEVGSFESKLVSTLTSSNPSFVYEYPEQGGDYIIELIMTNPGSTDCEVGSTNWTTTLSVEGATSSENQYYNDNACQIIRGASVSPSEQYSFLTAYNNLSDANKALLRTSGNENEVTLCTEQYISTFGVSRDALLANIANIVNNLELAQRLGTGTHNSLAEFRNDLINTGYLKVDNPSTDGGIVLSCKEFVGLTGQDGLPAGVEPSIFENQGDDGTADKGSWDTDYYTSVNQGKFYHEESEQSDNGYCEKTCIEAVTVSYGPPVATKGGICFEYKVKVVAEMVCETKINYDTKPKYEPACQPTPVCNSTAKYKDQGGPAEDFDACILEKDGGEYSQDAIDACYTEVYGYDDELANDMALVNDFNINGTPMMASYLVIGGTPINSTSATQIMNEVNAINSAGNGGRYDVEGNDIIWKCEGAYCGNGTNTYFNLGAYYFSSTNKAMQTIYNINGLSYGSYSGSLSGGYIIKAGGFKAGRTCHDSCSWSGCSTSDTLNNSEAVADYNNKLAEWNAEVQKCIGEATCSKSSSTYTMEIKDDAVNSSITNLNESLDGDNNEFTGSSEVAKEGDTDMIIDSGACYGKGDTSNTYMTEWTFPHTYINNKNGDIAFDKEGVDGWREEENKYCLPLDQPDVNTLWFDWYVNNMVRNPDTGFLSPKDLGLGSQDLTTSEQEKIIEDIEYNIFANTSNFGEYKWNIDIQCFFGSRSTNPTCEGDNCENASSNDVTDTVNETVNNYKYRSITLDNITEEEAEVLGFNWSESATNFNNTDYPVVPGELKEVIADRGSSIYEGDEYLDYHFVLTTEDLKEIRKYNEGKTYLDYGNNFITDEVSGVTFYVSDFLRDTLSDSAVIKVPNSNNACNNLLTSSECEEYILGGIINE